MARARTRRHAGAGALALAIVLLAAGPAAAAAPASWTAKADAIAAPWPGLQNADGSFRDYVISRDPTGQRDDYGDAILGYGLLATAARTGNADLAGAGLRALEHSLDHLARSPSTQVFHELATVSGYNLARARFPDHPVFARARSKWEDVLRRIATYRVGKREVTNKSIVESVVVLELVRTGLTSEEPGAVLHDPAAAVAVVKRFLASELPAFARPYERDGRALLGDLPLSPPAYHGLSVGMLARALALLGDDAPAAGRALLDRAAQASLAAVAPDGDVAYHGRSQLQAWTLTLTGYGAERAGLPALAELTLRRLVDGYQDGPEGFLTTPALGDGIDAALPGLDEYVAGASYAGLTLASLEWAIEAAGPEPAASAGAPSGAAFLGRGAGAWAVSRSGDVWFAVRGVRSSVRDLRYDFGLVAVKARGPDGAWGDVAPLRPRTVARSDSAGPVLRRGRTVGWPEGTLAKGRGGAIVARGGFRTGSGRWLRRGVTFTFAPASCGVRLSFPVAAGDRFEYSPFFAGTPKRRSRSIADATQSVTLSRPASSSLERGYSSGEHARLNRIRLRFPRATHPGSISITTCPR
jgi:hypothetical protein